MTHLTSISRHRTLILLKVGRPRLCNTLRYKGFVVLKTVLECGSVQAGTQQMTLLVRGDGDVLLRGGGFGSHLVPGGHLARVIACGVLIISHGGRL